jgi:hypothetical protein
MTPSNINTIFEQVAQELSAIEGQWSWRPNPPDWSVGGYLEEETSGVVLYARLDKSDKFRIRPDAPKDSRGQVPYVASKNPPLINVSISKNPSLIASDINRRLLPNWLPTYEQALAAIQESNQYESSTSQVAAEIAKIVGVQVSQREPRKVSFYRSPLPIFSETVGGAEVSGDSVKLELHLSHEDALALLRHMTR